MIKRCQYIDRLEGEVPAKRNNGNSPSLKLYDHGYCSNGTKDDHERPKELGYSYPNVRSLQWKTQHQSECAPTVSTDIRERKDGDDCNRSNAKTNTTKDLPKSTRVHRLARKIVDPQRMTCSRTIQGS